MTRCAALLVAVTWFVTASPGLGQEKYSIPFKWVAKGSVTHVEKTIVGTKSTKIVDNTGAILKDETNKYITTLIYDETILEIPDLIKRATVVRRNYQKATVKTGDDTAVLPFQDKTVIIEKKQAKYQFRHEGGKEIAGHDAQELDMEFNNRSNDFDFQAMLLMLLPKKDVAPNEEWKIAMAEFLKAFEQATKFVVDADKSRATAMLVRAYKKDGRQFGDVVITLHLPVKSLQTEGAEIVWQPGVLSTIELKTAACIDGSLNEARAQWTMNFNGKAQLPLPDNTRGQLTVSVHDTGTENVTEVQKK
jgi:hypothetical protein